MSTFVSITLDEFGDHATEAFGFDTTTGDAEEMVQAIGAITHGEMETYQLFDEVEPDVAIPYREGDAPLTQRVKVTVTLEDDSEEYVYQAAPVDELDLETDTRLDDWYTLLLAHCTLGGQAITAIVSAELVNEPENGTQAINRAAGLALDAGFHCEWDSDEGGGVYAGT